MTPFLLAAFANPPLTVGPFDPGRSFAPLVEAVAPGVVLVRITEATSNTQHAGSGFVVGADGTVVTAYHVIQDATALEVVTHDNVSHRARILGFDTAMDLAVLRMEDPGPFDWLAWGDSTALRVGDRVLAIGNPLGLGATVTAGIISGKGRDLALDRYWRSDDFLQTDAAINQGNSGGPLVGLDAKVVGMNTSIIAGANTVGFSVPSELLARIVPELIANGHVLRGFLGLESHKITDAARKKYAIGDGGALVSKLLPGSPAAKAGIRIGDIVTRVDDTPVASGADLLRVVGNRRPGESVELAIVRNQKTKRIKVVLGDRPEAP